MLPGRRARGALQGTLMSRPPKSYARMSLAEKQVAQREAMREPAVRCPRCDVQTTVADLLAHLETRCLGTSPTREEPHPAAKWVTWREALDFGVPRNTMHRWIRRGLVRSRTVPVPQRQYLLRDVVMRMAERRARRR